MNLFIKSDLQVALYALYWGIEVATDTLFCWFHHSSPLHKLLGRFSAMMVEEETVGGVEISNRLHVLSIKLEVEEIQILFHSLLVNGLRDDDYVILQQPAQGYLCSSLAVFLANLCVGGWKAFILSDIFTISAGKRLTKADMKHGSRPFIGTTDSNNGITAWVENTNESLDSEVLGVNYNGSVVETFYHPYECIFSDDVKRLHLKSDITASAHLMLFLKTMIIQQKIKFAYGYKFNEKRMQMQKIVLPIDSEEQPNWKYMETYMQRLEQQQIVNYLSYIERKQ